jgi:hypothetical protein
MTPRMRWRLLRVVPNPRLRWRRLRVVPNPRLMGRVLAPNQVERWKQEYPGHWEELVRMSDEAARRRAMGDSVQVRLRVLPARV